MKHHANQGTGTARAPAAADAELERRVGSVLRWGVYLSAVCLAIGLTLSLARAGDAVLAPVLMNGGLMILMATPVARVVFSLIAFALERDLTYVVCTLIVLAILLYSIGTAWL